jgi:hypothetical protein
MFNSHAYDAGARPRLGARAPARAAPPSKLALACTPKHCALESRRAPRCSDQRPSRHRRLRVHGRRGPTVDPLLQCSGHFCAEIVRSLHLFHAAARGDDDSSVQIDRLMISYRTPGTASSSDLRPFMTEMLKWGDKSTESRQSWLKQCLRCSRASACGSASLHYSYTGHALPWPS